MQRLVRALGNRGFSKPEWEAEFLSAYRSHGTGFVYASCLLGAFYFFAFFVVSSLGKHHPLLASDQIARLAVSSFLLLMGLAVRAFKPFFKQHYSVSCALMVCAVMVVNDYIAYSSQIDRAAVAVDWSLTSSSVFGTLLTYGFARLRAGATLVLAWSIAGLALLVGTQTAPDADAYQRMAVHLVAANLMGVLLYRFSLLRERKLFLQSKRKNHIAELRRMKERAESASRAKTSFLANMSHEIRTPMNGVIGALSMLNDRQLSDRDRLFVKSARDSARNLLNLLNEILDFAKLDSKAIRLVLQPFDPRELVHQAAQAFQAAAEQKGIRLRVDASQCPHEVRSLTGDEGKLRQVLLNLVSNAVKFTQAGEVVVSLSIHPQREGLSSVRLDVSDTGMGIPQDAMEQLFQPFFQVDAGPTRHFGGTGLGLAICKQIVQEMGGDVCVRSVWGVGSTFEIVLEMPFGTQDLCELPPEARDSGFADTLPPDVEDLRLSGKVLLVEDNEVNAFIASMTLESLGLSCEQARNGELAVEAFRQGHFDAVLMDCEMPVMDGYEASRRIRAWESSQGRPERTPIIALTAHALSGDREACLRGGMDDYLTKPFDRHALAVVLARWLRQHHDTPSSP